MKKKFRLISIEVSGNDAGEAAAVMGHAMNIAQQLAGDAVPRNTTVKVKGLHASATVTVNQEGE